MRRRLRVQIAEGYGWLDILPLRHITTITPERDDTLLVTLLLFVWLFFSSTVFHYPQYIWMNFHGPEHVQRW